MASTATPSLTPLLTSRRRPSRSHLITCARRDTRPALSRGRILSTEAILAVQALKRAAPATDLTPILSTTLGRLLKPDLLAALRELLRQGRADLALAVFAAARREPWYRQPDYGLCAEVVSAAAQAGMAPEVDEMLREVAAAGLVAGDERGLGRLVRAAIAAGSGGPVVALWEMMKEGGWVCEERLGRALSRGLRQLGEVGAAEEVERECQLFLPVD